jgi:hypothetical protein
VVRAAARPRRKLTQASNAISDITFKHQTALKDGAAEIEAAALGYRSTASAAAPAGAKATGVGVADAY